MTAKRDNDDEDISTETIVAPPHREDDADNQQLYDNDVQTFAISPPEDAEEEDAEDEVEEEEKFYFQKFLATRRGRGAGGAGGIEGEIY